MPFAPQFDDVYQVIRDTVQSTQGDPWSCIRLDEYNPAGRITDRLIDELKSADFCVADITAANPNVMWELGFVMALSKPTIILSQDDLKTLPFDIRDHMAIRYNRDRLASTLTARLRRSFRDSEYTIRDGSSSDTSDIAADGIEDLREEIAQLRIIVGEAVRLWKHDGYDSSAPEEPSDDEIRSLEGHWFSRNGSHVYSRVVGDALVSPYCYEGDDELTAAYFGWRRAGDYWFARYQWRDETITGRLSGFTFLRFESSDRLTGAWWSTSQEDSHAALELPPDHEGTAQEWVRSSSTVTPPWAEAFFADVEERGLSAALQAD